MIGLAGAHRTGKTTLAKAASEATGLPFVETSVSDVFRMVGLDPAEPMDFVTRMMVQNLILKVSMEKWQGYKAGFLSDRTPIDMLAYTLADVRGDTLDGTSEALLARYTADCMKASAAHFESIILVQPGIPVVPAPGKASLSTGYIEHLNALMLGLLSRSDFKPNAIFLGRRTVDLDLRVACVMHEYKRAVKRGLYQRAQATALH